MVRGKDFHGKEETFSWQGGKKIRAKIERWNNFHGRNTGNFLKYEEKTGRLMADFA